MVLIAVLTDPLTLPSPQGEGIIACRQQLSPLSRWERVGVRGAETGSRTDNFPAIDHGFDIHSISR